MTKERWGGRCDLCNGTLEIGQVTYTYFTPSTTTMEQAQAGDGFWAEDPSWGVCPDCKIGIELLDAGKIDREEWVANQATKSFARQGLLVIGDTDDELEERLVNAQMEHIIQVLKMFIDNRIPEYREEINQGVPLPQHRRENA